MAIALLIFWVWAFVMIAIGAAAVLAGLIVLFLGLWRRSRKQSLLGVLIAGIGCLASAPCVSMWLDQFHQVRPPRWIVQYGWPIGIAALALVFAAFVKCAWDERRWDLVTPPR